jgi:hypothetical protein
MSLLCGVLSTPAQFTITGVSDKATYSETVTFNISTQAGYNFNATLNWKPIPTGVATLLNKPDFYELRVDATNQVTSAVTSQYVRFIVESSERVGTEWGLPRHVPFPMIQSCSNEFAGAHFRLLLPASFPAGYSVPVAAWVVDSQDRAVRANGILRNNTADLFKIKRGVGSGFVVPTNNTGVFSLPLALQGLTTNAAVTIEDSVTWTTVSGTLAGAVTWPNNSRIQISAGTIVPAGSSLTVGEGTVVRVGAGVDITNNGTIVINGTLANPVVFMPTTTGVPWGGFVQHANNASFTATGTLFTGSGEDMCWYSNSERGCATGTSGLGSHRTEQPLVSLNGTACNLSLTDSAAIYLAGQVSHAEGGATKSYDIRFTRFLMQRATSCGQYTSASLTVNDSAFIEVPDESVNFEDEDHDAMYIVGGTHFFTNTLFGWTKDDGIDSGGTDGSSSGIGKFTYQSCWFESTFHEGNSLSGYKNVLTRDTVYFDCGQGIEGGYDAPTSRVDHCFFTLCETGIRHGDNYATFSMYEGPMIATNNISIYNHRDLFGFNWDNSNSGGWTNNYARFGASNNFVSATDTNYPNNTLWNPAVDAWRLGAFGGVGRVGAGFGVRGSTLAAFADGIPVGLSQVCTNEVRVDYAVDGTEGTHTTGTLVFPQGLARRFIPVPITATGILRVALSNPLNADVTGGDALLFQNVSGGGSSGSVVLSPFGSAWKYKDDGSEQGTAWRATNFNDSAWSSGSARLGFGGDQAPVATTIRRFVQVNGVDTTRQVTNFYFRRAVVLTNPAAYSTVQFRYQRDDGCVVYLNSNEVFRSNMPGGTIYATNFASSTVSGAPAALTIFTNSIAATNFIPGTNSIAVEVHQSTSTSSDIGWEMELLGFSTAAPQLSIVQLGTDVVLYWTDPTFALEQSATAANASWSPAGTNSPVGVEPTAPLQIFRLKK